MPSRTTPDKNTSNYHKQRRSIPRIQKHKQKTKENPSFVALYCKI